MDERKELPGIDRSSLGLEFGLKHIGKRQIHVVAAKQNVLSNADAFEFQRASLSVTAIRLKSAVPPPDITNQNDVTRTDQGTPLLPACAIQA